MAGVAEDSDSFVAWCEARGCQLGNVELREAAASAEAAEEEA
eukprot:CAMPEP_0197608068 /NCGR_PEP_ID=MMETSP1326-20131121/48329_1 /TAXON_ID=1155430 /ORGANISM="Genus nov. species nov., Strain RCC2288" /LENGTH=41 /DNA_ID= /DNA_START= /DNA_END= /DNA_ORIENTATION=